MRKLSTIEFNSHLRRVNESTSSFNKLYEYCLTIVKEFLKYNYGIKLASSFLKDVPHDVFTRVTIEYRPSKYVEYPAGYLCTTARNMVNSMFNDNRTLELKEDYGYTQEFEGNLEFTSEEVEKAWKGLDEKSRFILYKNEIMKYKLAEVAAIMGLSDECVRTKKSRAVKAFRDAVKNQTYVKLN